MQKHVNLVDLVKRFPTNIFLQNLASIQKGTSPIFTHLAEKSENGSISSLSTKVSSDRHPSLQHFGRSARSSSKSVIETRTVSLIEMSIMRSPKRSTACFFQRSVCIGRGMRWTRIKMGRFP